MTMIPRFLVLVAAVGAASVSTAHPAAKAGPKIPPAVEKAFHDRWPNAEIQKSEAEREGGVMVYDFEFRDGDMERECDMAADGSVLSTTLRVDRSAVPQAAMKGIEKAVAGGRIGRLERSEVLAEPKHGKIVKLDRPRTEFEAEFESGGRHGEVTVAEDGKLLEGPEWGGDDDAAGEKK